MRTLCLVIVVCAAAVYAQTPVDPKVATQQAASVPNRNTANNPVNGGYNTNNKITKVNNAVQNAKVINNPGQSANMISKPNQNGNMIKKSAQNGNMINTPVQNSNIINNIGQNRNMINNPAQNRINMNTISQRFRNMLNNRAGGMVRNYGSQMMQHMRQNAVQAPKTGHKSTQTGFPAHMLPFFLRSDRGTKIAIMNMMMNNPALAKFLPLALHGGLSDSMMRMMVVLGMSQEQGQGQGQGVNPLMAMAAMGGAEMSNIAPLLIASQVGANSAPATVPATGNIGAAAADPQGASQTGGSPLFDFMVMDHMM